MPRPIAVLDRSVYIHQFNYGRLGLSWAAIVARCRDAGANLIKLKALDGTHWMSEYDRVPGGLYEFTPELGDPTVPHPLAVTGPDKWAELAAEAEAGECELIPWSVPHGLDGGAELHMLDQLANYARKRIELDLEPYAGFWTGAPADLVTLVRSLFERAVEVWVDVDVRPYAAAALPLYELAPYVTRWLSQSYWTTFQVNAEAGVEADANLFAKLPAGDWGAIFPAGGYLDFQAAAELAASRDASEIGLWSLNVAPPAALPAFRSVA